ncbi:MAG: hypothetical protein DI604_13075 [Delftia acidovorans]|nr:MAG: hypothetical protein DI604_13075 [Delftia acidovorans]
MAERKKFEVPAEVTSYFNGKTSTPAFSWADVWAEEHAYKFTVAKAVELDVLNAFRSTISTAISEGQGFESWKPQIEKELTKLGWWGPRMVSDPTGAQPDRMVNFASDRRLKTTFWANMNSARAAGQWERAQRSKRVLPYVLYVRTTSSDPRVEHLQWVGLILPIDDPFWRTHWPPNGWQCKCQVRMISARERDRLLGTERVIGQDLDGNDIKIRYTDQTPDLGPDIQYRNRRTGEISIVPPGIDPGWQTNPGLARASTLVQNLDTKLAAAAPEDASRVLRDLWSDPYLRIAPRLPQAFALPAGHNAGIAAELGASSPVISITGEAIGTLLGSGLGIDDLSVLPDVLSSTAVKSYPTDERPEIEIIARLGSVIWRSILRLAQGGLMRIERLEQGND